ncbi:MAG TPA: DUF3300 domain-containing protein [Terrimicrobiaceae bacterium]
MSCLVLADSLRAQAPLPAPPPAAEEIAPPTLPPEALSQLLAPIALYPDALIALILPASTVPSDVVLAARYLASNGDAAQVANQPWEESVKSLFRYPDIVKWMDQNLEWTTQVGVAFLNQPADVMNTIQQLRAQAIAAGNLVDSPQQRVVKEEDYVRIVPAEPDVMYVPRYDPEVVYAQPYAPYLGPALTFGVGFAVGSWLNYDCDWPRRKVCFGDWNPRWRNDWNRGWNHKWKRNRGSDYNVINVVNINSDTARIWEPSAKVRRQQWQRARNYSDRAFNVNARGGRGDAHEGGRRFPAVARPSLPDFDGRAGDGDRRAWRGSNRDGSNLSRNLPDEIHDRGPLPGPPPGQSEQLNRGNSGREWNGKGKGDHQSNTIVRQPAESPSVKEKAWRADHSKGRKWNGDSESAKTSRSSHSVNGGPSHSKHSKSVHSKADDSSQQISAGHSKPSHSQGTDPSYSKANKHSQGARVERSKGGSKHSEGSFSKANKRQPGGGAGKKGGGGQKSDGGKKGGGKGDKGKG